MSIYKPLTPTLRRELLASADRNIRELEECQPSSIVSMQISSYQIFKNIINGLPDGFLIPFEKR